MCCELIKIEQTYWCDSETTTDIAIVDNFCWGNSAYADGVTYPWSNCPYNIIIRRYQFSVFSVLVAVQKCNIIFTLSVGIISVVSSQIDTLNVQITFVEVFIQEVSV